MTPALVVPVLGRSLYPGASVALDFTRNLYRSGTPVVKGSPSLLSGWTFTRASTGYAETAAGALVAFASGAPRITDKGLLVEEARTNLLLRSQEFDNASWTKTDTTITADSVLAPDGTTTADLATEGSATTATVGQSVTVSSGATVAISFYLKRGNTDWIRIQCLNGGNLFRAWFNLNTGAVGTSAAAGTGVLTSATIAASVNGFYRVVLVGSIPATTAYSVFINTASADNSSTRVSGGTYYPWGAQIEAGAFATSYIPTTTASATRAADVASISALSIPSPLTIAAEWTKTAESTGNDFPRVAALFDGASIEQSLFHRNATNAIRAFVTSTVDLTFGTGALNTAAKAAARFATNNVNGAYNGALGTADTTATVSTGATLTIGSFLSALHLCGYIRRVIIYPYAMTDAQLQAATA